MVGVCVCVHQACAWKCYINSSTEGRTSELTAYVSYANPLVVAKLLCGVSTEVVPKCSSQPESFWSLLPESSNSSIVASHLMYFLRAFDLKIDTIDSDSPSVYIHLGLFV